MIDIAEEKLIPLSDVPKILPARPTGRRLHISAVYRWIQRGTRGIRLEYIKIGGTAYASMEAMARTPFALPARTHDIQRAQMEFQAAQRG